MSQIDIAFVAGIALGLCMGIILTCMYVLFLAKKYKGDDKKCT